VYGARVESFPAERSPWYSDEDETDHDTDSVAEHHAREAQVDRLRSLLDRIPARDAYIFSLAYERGMTQTQIAELLGVSQPAVHYRLQYARWRLAFLVHWPGAELTAADIQRALESYFDGRTIRMLCSFFRSSCHSVTAAEFDLSPGCAETRIATALEIMADLVPKHPELEPYLRAFRELIANRGVLHEAANARPWPAGTEALMQDHSCRL
jgi:predicted transcriptional regulator